MSAPKVSDAIVQKAVNAYVQNDCNATHAAIALGVSRECFRGRLAMAKARGICAEQSYLPQPAPAPVHNGSKQESLRTMLRRGTHTVPAICERFNISPEEAATMLQSLRSQGFLVAETESGFTIHTSPPPAILTDKHQYVSRPGGYYKFGYTTDNHLCSKYSREDVLSDLYDWFAAEGVDRVINTGNYIDGEARFNKHDIHTHGMQNQLDYFCKNYPQRTVKGKPLMTYIVSGDDHEGWYGQREGVDIGWLMEQTARDKFGRKDLVNLGYIESFIRLVHAGNRDIFTYLLAVHPGGGSAYATSYAPQKYVEALQGGEKPAVVLFGHWHKMFDLLIRNVICLGGGCTKDLDTFGRKMKLAYHIGGMIVELWQDDNGAVTRWRVEKKQYFDRGYYNDQWSYTGMPGRVPA